MDSHTLLPFEATRTANTPDLTFVNQSRNAAGWTTAIGRAWPMGAGYCGLCPRSLCNLEGGFCLITVQAYVGDEDAPDFSLAAHLRLAGGLPADDLGPGRRFG